MQRNFSLNLTTSFAQNAMSQFEHQLQTLLSDAYCHLSTPTGMPLFSTSPDSETNIQSARMASAFVETDGLARSLKLGAVRKVTVGSEKMVQEKVAQTVIVACAANTVGEADVALRKVKGLVNCAIGE